MNLSRDNFLNCGWQAIVKDAASKIRRDTGDDRWDYSTINQAFRNATDRAKGDGDSTNEKIFSLLENACSMTLDPSNINGPYKPLVALEGKRSTLPEDFEQDEVTFFSQVVKDIADPMLCARLADLVWLLLEPKDPTYAMLAIDNYMQFPIHSWKFASRNAWERAICLCLNLGKKSKDASARLKKIEIQLLDALSHATWKDNDLATSISELLLKHKLCRARQLEIAEKLAELADEIYAGDYWIDAKNYYEQAHCVSKSIGAVDMFVQMSVKAAKCWEREAKLQSSNLATADYYEEAIQWYRSVPNSYRAEHDVESRLAQLRQKLESANKNSLGEMRTISSPGFDLNALIEAAKNSVKGKSVNEAFSALAEICRGASERQIRDLSQKIIKEHPFQSLVKNTYFSDDGRKIASRPGADFKKNEVGENIIFDKMVENYQREIKFKVQGGIFPALETMRQEHRLFEHDFSSWVKESPIVPEGRVSSITKALFAGYNNDFITALHLLVPQIEHFVRVHLKRSGVVTASLGDDGVETEKGLSALICLPKSPEIFGEDLTFEIRALFCEPLGPNLRNQVAHGLLDDQKCQSAYYSIYAWWFGFRIFYNAFIKAKNQTK